MRKLLGLLAAAALLAGVSGPAGAANVPFTGTLSIEIGTLPAIPAFGSGTAVVNGSLGTGPITSLAIPAGAFGTALTAPVPNAFPIIQIKLAGPGGTGSLQNGAISLSTGGTCTAAHPSVICPGGGLAGFGGLSGSALVGIFSTHTAGSGTGPVANLAIPLGVVGGGSSVVTTAAGIMVTVSGAGWTTGTASVINPSGFGSAHLANSQTVTFPTTTTPTAMGSGTGSAASTASLTLVTPVQIFNTATNSFIPSFARISLHFVPEPGTLLLLGSGVVGLALYGRKKMHS